LCVEQIDLFCRSISDIFALSRLILARTRNEKNYLVCVYIFIFCIFK